MRLFFSGALFVTTIVALSGCSAPGAVSSGHYSTKEAQIVLSINRGVVLSSEPVKVTSDSSAIGTAAGAVAGGVLGNQVGGGDGKKIMTAAGAIVGSMVGSGASQKEENAFAYVVQLSDSGELIQVVQTGELLPDNAPVFVKHLKSGRLVMTPDSSQGKTYSKPQNTKFGQQ